MPKMLFFFYIFLLSWLLILHLLSNMQPHPIFLILLILSSILLICFMISFWQSNLIYPILLFLIMISGLLIIFLYFSSLITNLPNKYNLNFLLLINFIINLFMILFLSSPNYFCDLYPIHVYTETSPLTFINQKMFQNLFMIYSYPYNNFTFLSISFLLISMFIIIKMCTIKSSSLRKIS